MEDTEELRGFREQWKREVTLHQDEAMALYVQGMDFEQSGNVAQGLLFTLLSTFFKVHLSS